MFSKLRLILTIIIVMKNGKTRLNHLFRKCLLEHFETVGGKVSALYALIREVKIGIEIGIQIEFRLKMSKSYRLFNLSKFRLGRQSPRIKLLNYP